MEFWISFKLFWVLRMPASHSQVVGHAKSNSTPSSRSQIDKADCLSPSATVHPNFFKASRNFWMAACPVDDLHLSPRRSRVGGTLAGT